MMRGQGQLACEEKHLKYNIAERSFGMRNEGQLEDYDHKPTAYILYYVTDAYHEQSGQRPANH